MYQISPFFYVLMVLLWNSVSLFGQDSTILPDSLAAKSFDEINELFYASKPDSLKALSYARAYFIKAKQNKDTMEMVAGKYLLANILEKDSIYLNYCDSLTQVYQKKPSKNFPNAIILRKMKFYLNRDQISSIAKELSLLNTTIKNDSLEAVKNLYLGLTKSRVGNLEEAMKYYLEAYHYIKKKDYFEGNDDFLSIPINIVLNYMKLKKHDSALIFNRNAYKIYNSINDSILKGYTFYNGGIIYYNKKFFLKSVQKFKKAIPSIIADKNYRVLAFLYSKMAISYDSLQKTSEAYLYHNKADSLREKYNLKSTSLNISIQYLIKHYKKNNDIHKQLFYINELLQIKEFELNERTNIRNTITKEFDIPQLKEEKLALENRLQKEQQASTRNFWIFISIIIVSIVLIGYQMRKNRMDKRRFLQILKETKSRVSALKTPGHLDSSNTPQKQNIEKKTINIPKETLAHILIALENFEAKEGYLDASINLQNLATQCSTNANYLSKVINHHKKVSFSNYINALRITYAIDKLKKEEKWRKYTVQAIANEVGFKNAESFSNAFYKQTSLRPSYFIKEIEGSPSLF